MKNKVNINDNSVDSAGIPKDYKEAVTELIWNGYDAGASVISISFDANEIDHINEITISDNGSGIKLDNIGETFGAFLDSLKKKSFQRSSYVRGKKGKGRFSFTTFAATAVWNTTYKTNEGKALSYSITINKNTKDTYTTSDQVVSKNSSTGTHLVLSDLFDVTGYSFTSDEFKEALAREFGWFLLLNKNNDYKLLINDVPLEYEHLIGETEEKTVVIRDSAGIPHSFTITYIRWNDNIGDKYYFYFLDDEKKENCKQLTSYNNQGIGFHHSLYIQSSYFNEFALTEKEPTDGDLFNEKNSGDGVYKALVKHLQGLVEEKRKGFVREKAAVKLIQKYENKGILPAFRNNKYDQERKQDLINTIKEIYAVQPKIFIGLNEEQEKTCVGFLNLLLDSEERERIIEIIDGVVKLSKEDRIDLANVIKKSSLSRIVKTIKLIESRFAVVELLKKLVFDLEKFATERDHIQKVIEENYWLFGEQFHLVSADENFEKLLSGYLHLLDGGATSDKKKKGIKIDKAEKLRRPDIFACRQRTLPDPLDFNSELEENIMVELKRPSVVIGKEQFRQIDDYLDFIVKETQFNSQTRKWMFFVVGKQVDEYIKKQYAAFKDRGKRFLVHESGNYEIHAMTWDDLFRTFDIKHRYLLDKLDFDKKAIEEELFSKGIKIGKTGANKVTKAILEITAEHLS